MPENVILILYAIGGGIAAIGGLWLLVLAFQKSVLWGLLGFIPGVLFLFALLNLKKAWLPLVTVLVGLGISASGFVYNLVVKPPPDTTIKVEEKTNEKGEVEERLTGTGSDLAQVREKLAASKNYRVIQVANLGLTDADLAAVEGMTKLTAIDLNDNPVTDATLERLSKLPNLTRIYIARTKVTPDGVKKHILDRPDSKVTEIDVTGLNVPGKAVRDWKSANKDRKANQ